MIMIAMTGSIATGKSTTAKIFAHFGIPVFDADAAVHSLYRGRAAPLIEDTFPGTTRNNAVDHSHLSQILMEDSNAFKTLEAIIHPLVRDMQKEFIKKWSQKNSPIVLFDIPLLFETCAEKDMDIIVVVTCKEDIQIERVFQRPGMTKEKFDMVRHNQMADKDKRQRAHFLVDSSFGITSANQQVHGIIRSISSIK